jgi:two-component system aerobic respiration control sensor histidine kinase ArcB
MPHEDKDEIIEELKAEVESLRLIIAKTPGNIYWKKKDGSYLGCNNNVARVLGMLSPLDIVGKKDPEVIGHELSVKTQKIDAEVIETLQEQRIEEIGFDEHGKPAIYLTRKTPLFDSNGNVYGIFGISFDITERKQMEEKLKIAKKKAESANRAKSRFLATISHELRTPLASILGFANLLQQQDLEDKKKLEYADYILDSGSYLLSLINTLLDYNKLETNKFALNLSPINLKELIQNVIGMLEGSAKSKQIPLTLEYDDNVPQLIMSDGQTLRQILINLIGNAIKFTEIGYVGISVICLQTSEAANNLQVSITDTGIGIPHKEQKSIFKKFYQLGDVYTRSASLTGTGLGLSIVKKLVKLLGGKINVKSEPGKGSTFCFSAPFPTVSSVYTTLLPSFEEPKKPARKTRALNKPQALLIEDNELIQIIHKHMLEELGCGVDISDSAAKTLEMLNNDYDILFVDIGLPDMAGFELIKKIRQQNNNQFASIPIIVLTGYSEEKETQQSLDAGADEVMIKPVNMKALKEILGRYIKITA